MYCGLLAGNFETIVVCLPQSLSSVLGMVPSSLQANDRVNALGPLFKVLASILVTDMLGRQGCDISRCDSIHELSVVPSREP